MNQDIERQLQNSEDHPQFNYEKYYRENKLQNTFLSNGRKRYQFDLLNTPFGSQVYLKGVHFQQENS